MPIKVVPAQSVARWGLSAECVGGLSNGIHPVAVVVPSLGQSLVFHPAELGPLMVLLAEHWQPTAMGVEVTEGDAMAWETAVVSGECCYPAKREDGNTKREALQDGNRLPRWLWGQADRGSPG